MTFTPYTSLQQMFDIAAAHLIKQNQKALDENGTLCRYRAEDGCMCAVGALIPDELYDEGFENRRAFVVLEDLGEKLLSPELDRRQVDCLTTRLQSIHDNGHPSNWRTLLHNLALDFHLNTQVLDG